MEYQVLKTSGGWSETRRNRHTSSEAMAEALRKSGNRFVTIVKRRNDDWPDEIQMVDASGHPHACRVRVSPSETSAQSEVKGSKRNSARTSRKETAA